MERVPGVIRGTTCFDATRNRGPTENIRNSANMLELKHAEESELYTDFEQAGSIWHMVSKLI